MSRVLGVLAALLLVAGPLSSGSATADDLDPTAGAPQAGACYDLTLAQVYEHSAPEAPVDCAAKHTLAVTAVGQVPDSFDWATVDWKHLPKSVGRAVYETCSSSVDKLVGSPVRRSRTLYEWFWFAPTDTEIAAGARWFSCSIGLDTSMGLIPIPSGQPAKRGKTIPDSVAHCVKRSKGGYLVVACSRAHQWRATYTKLVHRKPTKRNVRVAAMSACPRHMSRRDWLYSTYVFSQKSFVLRCEDKTRH